MKPSEKVEKHRDDIRKIMERYPTLSNLRIFGSVARGEDTEQSDVDFLIDPLPGASFFEFGGLHEDLEELLGVPVDIVSSNGRMNQRMKERILKEAVPV